jgi:uncharacterized DUF497 family protein
MKKDRKGIHIVAARIISMRRSRGMEIEYYES